MGTIVVLLDSDINAPQPALAKAVQIARAKGSLLSVYVNAYSGPLVRAVGSDKAHLERARSQVMAGWEKQLRRMLDKLDAGDTETHIFWEHAEAPALAEFITRTSPSLIILHRVQEPLLKRLLITPRDWRVIRKAPCPVLCVGEQPWSKTPFVLAAVDPDHDDAEDDLNSNIVATAKTLSQWVGGNGGLAHVVEYPDETLIMLAGEAVPVSLSNIDALRTFYWQRLLECANHYGVDPDSAVMLEGAPHRALAEHMAEHPGILVLGTVHRGALRRLLLGSTAEQILLHSDSDVLVVKPSGFSSPWQQN
ncbi:MAG: universal stress protein [Gammaproteobacteria bacterium HGW-Gammaproteobacteria-14]|nr:MAG: universal stress protein [Gammaproteobacteria bacterium HGW-Gammaproteobacteria-14]